MSLLVVGGVTAAMNIGKVSIALPVLQAPAGGALLSVQGGAWLLALPGIVGSLCAAGVGLSMTRVPLGGVFRGALVGAALAALLGASAGSAELLLACRTVEALCGIAVMVTAPVLLTAVVRVRDAPLALGIWGGYMPLGQALVVLCGAWVIGHGGWPMLWIVVAVTSLLTALASAFVRLPRGATAEDGPAPGPAAPTGWMPLAMLAGIFMMYTLQWMALTGYLPTLLTDLGLSLLASGALSALVLLGNVAGNVGAGVLGRRGVPGALVLGVAGTSMLICGALVFASFTALEVKVLCAVAFSTLGGAIPGTLFALALAQRSPGRQWRSALLVQGSQIGSALGPLLVGWAVALAGGWYAAAYLIVAAGGIGLCLTAGWVRSRTFAVRATGPAASLTTN
ncbi:MAG TPA: MFS transporter [Mycobacterium sp.]|nr:MFS transporter [Mycobacterium sp.]